MLPLREATVEALREVGGYRVVRTLARRPHALRLLVHADGRAWVARVFATECPDDLINHDLAVSDVVRLAPGDLGRHTSVVHDLSTTDDGRVVLIEEYLAGPRLDALLRARHERVTLGEAVTILAPLVRAIDEGHRLGLTGLLLDTTSVRLRASGAPVLSRRSTARIGPPLPERFRDREPRYSVDQDALDRVSAAIAAALPRDEQSALLAVMRRRDTAIDHALFDLAAPLPVRFESEAVPSDDAHSEPRASGALTAMSAPMPEVSDSSQSLPFERARGALVAALYSLGLPASVVSAVGEVADALAGRSARAGAFFRARVASAGRTVRPRWVLAGVAGVAAMVVALALTGQTSAPGSGTRLDPASPSAVDDSPPTADESDDSGPRAPVPELAETELHPELETWPALVEQLVARWIACVPRPGQSPQPELGADDPVEVVALADCTAAVVHEGSAAAALIMADDPRHRVLIDWHRAGGESIVVERMGAAVLVDLIVGSAATASLLIVRSEAGWRIRDVIG